MRSHVEALHRAAEFCWTQANIHLLRFEHERANEWMRHGKAYASAARIVARMQQGERQERLDSVVARTGDGAEQDAETVMDDHMEVGS